MFYLSLEGLLERQEEEEEEEEEEL